MIKSKISKITILTLVICVVSISAFQYVQGKTNTSPSMETNQLSVNKDENTSQNIEEKINNIKLSKEVEDKIRKSDSKNEKRDINNYKQIIVELNIPDEYRKEIEKLIEKYEVSNIFIAYEFLHENYGKLYELELLLHENKSGKDFEQIFSEYKNKNKEYVPSDFPTEYLEDLLNNQAISYDDIMIADRLSSINWQLVDSKTLKTTSNSKSKNKNTIDAAFIEELMKLDQLEIFEKLIDMKKASISWEEIKIKLGILDIEENLTTITIDSNEISTYLESTNLSKENIIEALVLAKKHGFNKDDVIKNKESKMSESDLLKKHLTKKYSDKGMVKK